MYVCPVCDQVILNSNILYSSSIDNTKKSIDLTCGVHYEAEIFSDTESPGEVFVETWFIEKYRIDINREEPFWISISIKSEYQASDKILFEGEVENMPKFKTETEIENWLLML